MLYNRQGQEVKVNIKFNSKDNPNMFKDLVERKEPSPLGHGKMFNLGTRAKFKQ